MASSWIWQQPEWPRFRWKGSALEPLLKHARAAHQDLLSRESLGTAAIEGELLDPGQVRSSIARRALGQPIQGKASVFQDPTIELDKKSKANRIRQVFTIFR